MNGLQFAKLCRVLLALFDIRLERLKLKLPLDRIMHFAQLFESCLDFIVCLHNGYTFVQQLLLKLVKPVPVHCYFLCLEPLPASIILVVAVNIGLVLRLLHIDQELGKFVLVLLDLVDCDRFVNHFALLFLPSRDLICWEARALNWLKLYFVTLALRRIAGMESEPTFT